MSKKKNLKGITWNHSRGYVPMVASAQRYSELNPNIEIEWSIRSLQEFADKPVDKLSEKFDLLVIDHPWVGLVSDHEVFLKLEEYLPSDFLKDQTENSVGKSFKSYKYNESQWAIPLDAAAPVASSRPDLLEEHGHALPKKFDDIVKLGEKGLIVFPAIPIDTLMHFYMFCSAWGEDPFRMGSEFISEKVGVKALKSLRTLAKIIDPACFDWNPIKVYEVMTRENKFDYCPFAYGYVNYTKKGFTKNPVHFHDLAFFKNSGRLKTTLGGTGLAISKRCREPEIACEYLQFVTSGRLQSTIYFDCGGQPGHREAWKSFYTNERSNNFFTETLPALDRAFLRPRYNGYMHFQDNAGVPIRDYMMNGGNEKNILNKLNQLYKESLTI